MSSAQTSLSGTNPIGELRKHGQLVEQLAVFLEQLAIHGSVNDKTLEAAQDTLNKLQTAAPNLDAIVFARAIWLDCWITLLEQDFFEKLLNDKMTQSIFYINNQNKRWPTIAAFLKRSYLKDHFKPKYLRVMAILDRIAEYEKLHSRHNPFFTEVRARLADNLLEGRV